MDQSSLFFLKKVVIALLFGFLINFELILGMLLGRTLKFIFCMWLSSCSSTIGWKENPSDLNCLDIFVKNQLTVNVRVNLCLWLMSPSPMPIFAPVPSLDYCSFILSFELGGVSPPILFSFFKMVLPLLGPRLWHQAPFLPTLWGALRVWGPQHRAPHPFPAGGECSWSAGLSF